MALNKGLTLIDLFAGCGGLALGFHQAGFETLIANELHPDPAATYIHNLLSGSAESMIVGPIQKVLKKSIKCEINFEIPFESNKIATSIKRATDPENEGWVESIVEDNIMKAKVKATNMGSLREAAEDFMACISVAKNILKK